jgi:hypothetical protein
MIGKLQRATNRDQVGATDRSQREAPYLTFHLAGGAFHFLASKEEVMGIEKQTNDNSII